MSVSRGSRATSIWNRRPMISALKEELRLAICAHWEVPNHSVVHHACNDRVTVLARSASPIPGSLVMSGGLDFLLRQAVVVEGDVALPGQLALAMPIGDAVAHEIDDGLHRRAP